MIYYALQKMQEAGIKEVLIVTGIEQCGTLIEQCGDGKDWDLNLTYKVQTQAGGIAQAISLAQNFTGKDSLFVILGDNIFNKNMETITKKYNDINGAVIFLKQVKDPERFGVAEFHIELEKYSSNISIQKIIVDNIEEKPKNPKSDYAVTGIYVYDNSVFDRIRNLKASDRGELEVTDLNNSYLKDKKLEAIKMQDDQWWTDAGTFESLAIANNLIKELK